MRITTPRPPSGSAGERVEAALDEKLGVIVSCRSGVSVHPLKVPSTVILGRASSSDIPIDDDSVSRRHARMHVRRSEIVIEDLGSSNGTFVRGRRVPSGEKLPLAVGAAFEVGSATLIVQEAKALQTQKARSLPKASSSSRIPLKGEGVIRDRAMQNLYALLDAIAPSPLSVLILGETGAGKQVYAEEVHRRSSVHDGPFVQLNCAALPESILESELFGYEKGAFTGAVQAKAGLFEAAHGGTVFLDEIGELPLTMQAKLLRVLESRQVMRLGSVKLKRIHVRVVSATNRDLRKLVNEGGFRPDLYFRLNGMSVTLPPLRARKADIGPIAQAQLDSAAQRAGKRISLSEGALVALERYDWPGNVRELSNVMERAAVLCPPGELTLEHLALVEPDAFSPMLGDSRATRLPPGAHAEGRSAPRDAAATGPFQALDPNTRREHGLGALRDELKERERAYVLDALAKTGGNQSKAARLLGISRHMLIQRIEEYGLARPRKST